MTTIDVVEIERDASRTVIQVTIHEGRGSTQHRVTVKTADLERLAVKGEQAPAFVRRCFEFLLAREPKESILSSFDVTVIGRYFPEFESTIQRG
jgi:hypothetical protein